MIIINLIATIASIKNIGRENDKMEWSNNKEKWYYSSFFLNTIRLPVPTIADSNEPIITLIRMT